MARIYITREGDGTFTIRGTRFEGKSLAARRVVKQVSRKDVGTAAGSIMRALGNRADTPIVPEGTPG